MAVGWDLTALLNAGDPAAPLAERHLWVERLMERLRHAPRAGSRPESARGTPQPLRLRLLLNAADRDPAVRDRLQALAPSGVGFWWRRATLRLDRRRARGGQRTSSTRR